MDLKGITWVGNIYQKFEAMCLEVEEIMYQDTVDFVENRVQTVGASVKKFYSGVVEDLLPPSSIDSGKKDISGISLEDSKEIEYLMKRRAQRKLSQNIGQVERKNTGVTPQHGARNVENVFPIATTLSTSENQTSNDGASVKESQPSEICEIHVQTTEEEDDDAIRIAVEAEKRCEAIADPSCDLAGPSQEIRMGTHTFSVGDHSIDVEDIQRNNGDEEIDYFFNPGQVEESYMICTDSGSFFEQKEATFACGSNLEKLEESCIFVDGDELQFLALNKGGKQRHHKKTLREAFSPRKRSSRAQEYKQLAVKYSDESNEEEQTSRFQEVGESEWEIL